MSENGREQDPKNITVIGEFPSPTNVKGIVKFLEHVRWYRELIPNFSKITVPIVYLLKKDVRFEWTEACQRAFEKLKDKLNTCPI